MTVSFSNLSKMKIGKTAYKELVTYWTRPETEDLIGAKTDMRFVGVTHWVDNATLIDHIRFEDERWHVSLIFTHPSHSNTFVMRRVSSHPTYESARFNARILCNKSAANRRRTLSIVASEQLHKN